MFLSDINADKAGSFGIAALSLFEYQYNLLLKEIIFYMKL